MYQDASMMFLRKLHSLIYPQSCVAHVQVGLVFIYAIQVCCS